MSVENSREKVREDRKRAQFIQDLYEASGRTNGVYTGLWADFCQKAGYVMRDQVMQNQLKLRKK